MYVKKNKENFSIKGAEIDAAPTRRLDQSGCRDAARSWWCPAAAAMHLWQHLHLWIFLLAACACHALARRKRALC